MFFTFYSISHIRTVCRIKSLARYGRAHAPRAGAARICLPIQSLVLTGGEEGVGTAPWRPVKNIGWWVKRAGDSEEVGRKTHRLSGHFCFLNHTGIFAIWGIVGNSVQL